MELGRQAVGKRLDLRDRARRLSPYPRAGVGGGGPFARSERGFRMDLGLMRRPQPSRSRKPKGQTSKEFRDERVRLPLWENSSVVLLASEVVPDVCREELARIGSRRG